MTHKIKDLVDVLPVGSRDATMHGSEPSPLATFLLSYEIGDAVARAVERLSASDDGPHNCLIVGGAGCGKSRLLVAIRSVLEAGPSTQLHARLAELRRSLGDAKYVAVTIPDSASDRRLSGVLADSAFEKLNALGFELPDEVDSGPHGSRLERLARALSTLPVGLRVVFVLDNLDRWLDTSAKYALENAQALIRLGELSCTLPVATCATAGEYVLRHDATASGQGWIRPLLDTYRIEYVPARALRTATASNILVKNARQRRDIGEVLTLLRTKLPELECGEEEFVQLYPLEVSTWTVGSHLHRWLQGFSFPEFAAWAAESVKRRPAPSLFALNDMFTLYEPQLRHVAALAPSFAAYDRLVVDALPRLGQSQRLWGRLALQSIFMHSLAGIAADVRTITNSVLLYDLHGAGSSYTLMTAVLKQLETLDRGQLVASGEGTARRYSLVTGEREALLVLIEEMVDAIEDDEEAVRGLLGVGGHVFADWPFGPTSSDAGRVDLWEIEQSVGRITLEARSLDPSGEHPRLVLFSPGRPWSEASDAARARQATACWIGAMPTPAEYSTMLKWLACSRLAASDRGKRFTDLPAVLADLERAAVDVFRRVYVDGGARVTAERSEPIADFVHTSRDENFVVRLLPIPEVPVATRAAAADSDSLWLAHLLAEDRSGVESMATWIDSPTGLRRLETWYSTRVARDDTGPMRLLGERGSQIPEIVEALDAKQLFDVSLYYARRALAAGSVRGLGDAVAKIFETPDKLWASREHLAWLERFADWVPSLELVGRYLHEAERVNDEDVENLRTELLGWLESLSEFVSEKRRVALLNSFHAYRDEYSRIYVELHDASVGAENIDRLSAQIVESPSWQALDALSSLSIGNQSYLVDAINLISVLRDAHCTANVRGALVDSPKCSCGFRFADRERVDAMASSASEFLEMGIDHHRRLLQARREDLRERLIACKAAYDIETIRAIADLTKEGPLPAFDRRTIEAVNELIEGEGAGAHPPDDDGPKWLKSKTL